MTLTKIEAEIEIPEGFEFDRLDTKTRVGDYDFEGYQIGHHTSEYNEPRIILRKKSKPAYRVYIDEEGIPFVAQRYKDGDIWQTYKECEYLTDWVEYDPPKKWPTPLVERIAAIDLKAAEWIVGHWDDLLDEKYTGKFKRNSRESETLQYMFYWTSSSQGDLYWRKISKQLGE